MEYGKVVCMFRVLVHLNDVLLNNCNRNNKPCFVFHLSLLKHVARIQEFNAEKLPLCSAKNYAIFN